MLNLVQKTTINLSYIVYKVNNTKLNLIFVMALITRLFRVIRSHSILCLNRANI